MVSVQEFQFATTPKLDLNPTPKLASHIGRPMPLADSDVRVYLDSIELLPNIE